MIDKLQLGFTCTENDVSALKGADGHKGIINAIEILRLAF